MAEEDWDIPESNREIALHLRAIRLSQSALQNRVEELEKSVDSLEDSINERRFKLQDVFVSSLLLPLVGGMMLFLLTKALG